MKPTCPKCKAPMVSAEKGSVWVCLEHGVQEATHKAKVLTEGNVVRSTGISQGESLFAQEWNERYPDLPFVTEFRFHTFRDWQLDFAWPFANVCVEMEGVDHRKTQRYASDLAKYNALAFGDWALFRCTMKTLNADARRFCAMVEEKIRTRYRK